MPAQPPVAEDQRIPIVRRAQRGNEREPGNRDMINTPAAVVIDTGADYSLPGLSYEWHRRQTT